MYLLHFVNSQFPLLEASIDGAHGVLLSIAGGSDLGLFEISEAAELVAQSAHPDANIIYGTVIDDALGDEVRVTVIAAGFEGGAPKYVAKPSITTAEISGEADPINAEPAPAITLLTSAKSRLIKPGVVIKSVMP